MNYEAAEMMVVGRAQDVILGLKELSMVDNRVDPDALHMDSPLGVFEE